MFEPTEEQRRLIEIKKEIREEWRRQKEEDSRRELWEDCDADALLTDAPGCPTKSTGERRLQGAA